MLAINYAYVFQLPDSIFKHFSPLNPQRGISGGRLPSIVVLQQFNETFHFKTNHTINDVITCPPTLFTLLSPVQRI
jgi:hypothetical protein